MIAPKPDHEFDTLYHLVSDAVHENCSRCGLPRSAHADQKRETFAYCKCGHPYSFHSDGHGVGECSDCKCRRYEFGDVR